MSLKEEVDFSLKFLNIQNASTKSTIFSPVSLLNTLVKIYVGADENTADEIANVIGKGKNKLEIINLYSESIKRHNIIRDTIALSQEYEKIIISESGPSSSATALMRKRHKRFRGRRAGPKRRKKLQRKSEDKRPKIYNGSSSDSSDSTDDSSLSDEDVAPKAKAKEDVVGFQVFMADKMFIDTQTHILEDYNQTMKLKFDGEFLRQVNFKEDKNGAQKIINEFVNDVTKEKIKNVFEPTEINKHSAFILVNATTFIGRWATPFEDRKKEVFYSKPPREMDMMKMTKWGINYTEGSDWKCIGIPYMENKAIMFIVLPKVPDGLQNLINQMDSSMFMECIKYNRSKNITVNIPAFEITGNYDLIKTFEEMGIKDLFDKFHCNLSKMVNGTKQIEKNNIFLEKAVHKAVIKVDEYGTGVKACKRSDMIYGFMPEIFNTCQPFIFFIVSFDSSSDKQNWQQDPNGILFAGTYC